MDEIHILQLGEKDWNDLYTLPETVYLDHIDTFSKTALKSYDLFFSTGHLWRRKSILCMRR